MSGIIPISFGNIGANLLLTTLEQLCQEENINS